jgi:hypothetical protein
MVDPCHFAPQSCGSQVAGLSVMTENKMEPIKRIVKLVETVHQGALLFAFDAARGHTDPSLQQFAEKILEKAEQFEFELRTELTRLSVEPAVLSDKPDVNVGLEMILESYQQTLATNITPHARAMIRRQLGELQRAYEEFTSTQRAA